MSDLEQGVPAGGSTLSGDDAPTSNDGTAGADASAGDASTSPVTGSADADQTAGDGDTQTAGPGSDGAKASDSDPNGIGTSEDALDDETKEKLDK